MKRLSSRYENVAKRGILPGDDAWYSLLYGYDTLDVVKWLLIDGPKEYPELFRSEEGEFVQFDQRVYMGCKKRF